MAANALDVSQYFAPVDREVETGAFEVTGAIPPELSGTYIRNGSNPKHPGRHLFMGDGMLHGIELAGGVARRYANRWVRTSTFEHDVRVIEMDGTIDLRAGVANTSVVEHAGRLFALVESSYPCEIDAKLETLGAYDFDGALRTPMTAHPKRCPLTGELHFFGYSPMPQLDALTYHRVDAAGKLVESRPIDVPGRTMMHDFAITSGHVVFLDLPIVFDLERAIAGQMPFRWSDEYGARIGVMRREPDAPVRWHTIEPCYVFHVLNAFEANGRLVVDGARYPELWRDDTTSLETANLHRWTLDLASGSVTESALDEFAVEFPKCDEARTGLDYRYGYTFGRLDDRTAIVKYDLANASSARHVFERGQIAGEFTFVRAPDAAAEDEGWLLGFVYDRARDRSDFAIFEARDLAPVARVHLPYRVPGGFHGAWVASQPR